MPQELQDKEEVPSRRGSLSASARETKENRHTVAKHYEMIRGMVGSG